jgi:hypothetical protein
MRSANCHRPGKSGRPTAAPAVSGPAAEKLSKKEMMRRLRAKRAAEQSMSTGERLPKPRRLGPPRRPAQQHVKWPRHKAKREAAKALTQAAATPLVPKPLDKAIKFSCTVMKALHARNFCSVQWPESQASGKDGLRQSPDHAGHIVSAGRVGNPSFLGGASIGVHDDVSTGEIGTSESVSSPYDSGEVCCAASRSCTSLSESPEPLSRSVRLVLLPSSICPGEHVSVSLGTLINVHLFI